MSNLRDFSRDAYDELCQVIDTGIGEYQFGDFFKHIFSSEINFDKYTGSISEYYKSIVDKHSIDEDTLKRIFKNVSDCDDEFRANLLRQKEKLDMLDHCISNLVDIFNKVGDSYVFESDDFLSANCKLYDIKWYMQQYYFKSFYHDGKLDTDAISKVMNMNPADVSNEQIEALVLVLSEGICQEDGLINTELLEQFMDCAYIFDGYVPDYNGNYSPYGIYTFKLSEVLDKVSDLFNSKVNTELKAGGWELFFDDVSFGEAGDKQAYLTSKMTLAEILAFMKENYSLVKTYESEPCDPDNPNKDGLPSIKYVTDAPGYYHISCTPYNQSQQDSYIFDFNKLVYTAINRMLNININDDKRNFIDELFSKWFDLTRDEACEYAEDGVYAALDFTSEASALVGFIGNSIKELWDLYKEIEESNAAIEALGEMHGFAQTMQALFAGGTLVATNINAPNNTLLYDIHNLTFKRQDLVNKVKEYNAYLDKRNFAPEEKEKLKVDLEKVDDYLEKGSLNNIKSFKYYISWYLSTGGDRNSSWHPNI